MKAFPQPLISIGIPTYNRGKLLRRAIESAMGQDYLNLEILISDNVSTDDTPAVCAAYTARDPRVRYIRQQENRGATGNFRAAFENTRGEFFVWLGDDDWFDPTYVRRCAEVLMRQPDYAIVGGRVRYYAEDELLFEESPTNLLSEIPAERVLRFYREVEQAGIFYGVIRRSCLEQTLIHKVPGFDWMVTAALAGCGKVATLDDTTVHRATGGATKNYASTAASLGIPRLFMLGNRTSYSVIAWIAFTQIAWTCPAFHKFGMLTRCRLAFRSAAIVMSRFVIPRSRAMVLMRRVLSAMASGGRRKSRSI